MKQRHWWHEYSSGRLRKQRGYESKLEHQRTNTNGPTNPWSLRYPESQGVENTDLVLFVAVEHPIPDVSCRGPLPTDDHNLCVAGKQIDLNKKQLDQTNRPSVFTGRQGRRRFSRWYQRPTVSAGRKRERKKGNHGDRQAPGVRMGNPHHRFEW